MKPIINEKSISKHAYRLVCSRSVVVMKRYEDINYFRKQLDFRTIHGKSVFLKIKVIIETLNFYEVSEKQRNRANNKHVQAFENYINNKLTTDYFKNKNDIRYISDNCISFLSGRNHFAKNIKDLNVLTVLRKYFIYSKKVN